MQKTIEYSDNSQTLIGTLITCDQAKGTVIVYPAFEGPSEFAIHYAEDIAKEGFNAFVADIYGDGKTADTLEGCFELITPFLQDRSLVRRRANLAFETAAKMEGVDASNIGAIGFCFGGMCALEVARSGAKLKSLVSAHGVLAKSDLPTATMKTRMLILHGFEDPQVPPQNLFDFSEEVNAAGVRDWTFTFFGHGKHSFTDPLTGTFDAIKENEMGREYNEIAANRTKRYAIEFFNETLS